ncbi:MAG: winged helix-turn-helix transcriptional regulator [Candidatus Thorarchaeota archaeon]
MDDIDKRIIFALDRDCRLSYQAIADKIGLTANATKKRIGKLVESGVIDRFMTTLSLAMIDADLVLAIVQTDGTEFQDDIIEKIGSNPSVVQVSAVASGIGGLYFVFAALGGSKALLDFGSNIRRIDSVKDLDIHVTLSQKGKKVNLSKTQKKVLRHLVEDPRASITDVAKATGMTARRARRAIDDIRNGGGVAFAVFWNLGKGGLTEVLMHISYDEKSMKSEQMVKWLEQQFPNEYWSSFISAVAPVVFARFVVSEIETAERISKAIRKAPFVESVTTLVLYSNNIFDWPGTTELKKLLENSES